MVYLTEANARAATANEKWTHYYVLLLSGKWTVTMTPPYGCRQRGGHWVQVTKPDFAKDGCF